MIKPKPLLLLIFFSSWSNSVFFNSKTLNFISFLVSRSVGFFFSLPCTWPKRLKSKINSNASRSLNSLVLNVSLFQQLNLLPNAMKSCRSQNTDSYFLCLDFSIILKLMEINHVSCIPSSVTSLSAYSSRLEHSGVVPCATVYHWKARMKRGEKKRYNDADLIEYLFTFCVAFVFHFTQHRAYSRNEKKTSTT